MTVSAIGLLVANSASASVYFGILKTYVGGLSILHWVNDALMAMFFLLVGLEIKRELIDGQLASWPRRILPGIAAAAGMAAPASIYVALNAGSVETLRGWAVPAATDIAFALGVLALLGSRVPVSLKIFLTALAILDDLGAVLIIALFYSADLSLPWLGLAGVVLVVLAGFNRARVTSLVIYLLLGAVLWFFMLKSGVHATLAGVALAFTVPLRASPALPDHPASPLHRLEHAIHPWVAFLIVPLFGFANAGVALSGMSAATLLHPVTLGVAAGLFFGKQGGIFLSIWATVKLGLARAPDGSSWPQIYGISVLAGVGFTMSLFVGMLAFPASPELQNAVKVGVLAGSLISAIVGMLVLRLAPTKRGRRPVSPARDP